MFNYQNPTRAEREQIITAAVSLFRQRFYDPKLNGFDLDGELQNQMGSLLETPAFPAAMKEFFRACGSRPIDFFYESQRRVSLGKLLKATFFKSENAEPRFSRCLDRRTRGGGRYCLRGRIGFGERWAAPGKFGCTRQPALSIFGGPN